MNSNHDDNIANILFQNEHFIVIDKPHDVRMDGDFNITIKKLLVNTFPGTNESSFKWVHQLDFATSGTLCVAKTREAAALACLAFELRETVKEYIAVVEGHVNTSSWPVRNLQSLNNIKESIQESIVTSTPDFDTEPDTNSDQYMSSEKKYKLSNGDESSASWQDQVMSQNLKLCLSKLSTYLLEHCSESFEELNALSIIPYQSYCRNHKLRKRLRKGLKSVGIELEGQLPSINSSIDTAIGQVSTSNSSDGTDTTTGRATIDEIGPSRPKVSSIDTHMQELWRDDSQEYIFRLDSENHDSVTQDSENQYSEAAPLVIAVPLVEPLEDFRMDICPNSSSFSSARCVYSETWMYVIGHGYYQVSPVTLI